MKQIYICRWEAKPGPGEEAIKYKTFDKARKGIQQLICEHIDMDDCINDIRKGCNPAFRNAVADFLYAFFHHPESIKSDDDIPSGNPNDYIPNDVAYVENYCDSDDEDDDEYYAKYDFKFETFPSGFYFRYIGDNKLRIYSYLLYHCCFEVSHSYNDYVFSFECPCGEKTKDMVVMLDEATEWGKSAYPVMVLKALQDIEGCLSQTDIINYIEKRYGVIMERKAVGRHLDMLKALGYKIQRGKNGFWLEK